jgi:hypothetical protein
MRDLVADEHFLHKKKIEKLIAAQYPQQYISPYQMVSLVTFLIQLRWRKEKPSMQSWKSSHGK